MPKDLHCPACQHPLTAFKAGPIYVDLCRGGCGGVWFDTQELQLVDEANEAVAPEALEVPFDPQRPTKAKGRSCPYCPNQALRQHSFSSKGKVMVDSCPQCGGCFLDRGELDAIRQEFPSAEAREAAALAVFENTMGQAMAEAKAESQAKVQKAQAFAHALRFILPSYWIPGKQEGGAF